MDVNWTYDAENDRHTCTVEHCTLIIWQDAIGRWVARIHTGRRVKQNAEFNTLDDTKAWSVVEARRMNANDRRQQKR